METKINWMICLLAGLLFGACSGNRPVQIQGVLEADPDIFPDYKGVTVPMNIAPLNFSYLGNEPCRLVVEVAGHEQTRAFFISGFRLEGLDGSIRW